VVLRGSPAVRSVKSLAHPQRPAKPRGSRISEIDDVGIGRGPVDQQTSRLGRVSRSAAPSRREHRTSSKPGLISVHWPQGHNGLPRHGHARAAARTWANRTKSVVVGGRKSTKRRRA